MLMFSSSPVSTFKNEESTPSYHYYYYYFLVRMLLLFILVFVKVKNPRSEFVSPVRLGLDTMRVFSC